MSVRRVVGRTEQGRPQLADVVGDLVGLDSSRALVQARTGLVEIALASVAVAKIVPASTKDELDLEAVVARGWRAADTAEIGGWLLRANGGFTGRANSVLPIAAPGMVLDEAIAASRRWYSERGLPTQMQVPVEARRLLDAGLAERGWTASTDVHVMTAHLPTLTEAVRSTGHAAALSPDHAAAADAIVEGAPSDDWLGRYRDGAATNEDARGLLVRHDQAGFAAIRIEHRTVAIGRGTIDDDWLGVTAVEVDPAYRRAGLATQIMQALWSWGSARGAIRTHLEVSVDNVAALALYGRLGYWVHHDYHYRTEPPA